MKGVQYCVKYKTRQEETVRFDMKLVVPLRLGWDGTRWGPSAENALSLDLGTRRAVGENPPSARVLSLCLSHFGRKFI